MTNQARKSGMIADKTAMRLGKYVTPEKLTVFFTFAYIVYFSIFTVTRHKAFMTQSFDLSIYVQMLWNSLHGEFFRVSIQPGKENYLQHHFAPSMVLFIPLYWMWMTPEWLLILQTFILASAAWPIFKITSKQNSNRWVGVVFALVYLLYPAMQAANLYDFHEITIAAPLLAWAWYFAQERKWIAFGIACALALGFREEVVIFTTGMGLVLCFHKPSRWVGLGLISASLVWLTVLVSFSLVQNKYSTNTAYYFQKGFELGENPAESVKNIITEPSRVISRMLTKEKVFYLINLFAPAGYLLFFSWEFIFLVLPFVGISLLSSYWLLFSPAQAQYNVLVVPFIVISSGIGAARVIRKLSEMRRFSPFFWNLVIITFVLLLSFGYHFRLAHLPYSPYFRWPQITERHLVAEQIARSIPQESSLSVQDNLAPHASHRKDLYIFPEINQAEYIFLDVITIQDLRRNKVVDLTPELKSALTDVHYETLVDRDGFLLLRRIN